MILSDDKLKELKEQFNSPHYLEKLIKRKPYQLSSEVEEVLASLSPTFQSAYELYGTTKMLDIAFESFEHNHEMYPLDYATFENEYEDSSDPEFRRKVSKLLVMHCVNINTQQLQHIINMYNKKN